MPRNIVEKVLRDHLAEGGYDPGTEIGIRIGQIAVGAGGLDVAVAMGGGPFHLACPRVYLVKLARKLHEWVSAKDVVLHMLSILSTRGNGGVVLEYGGEGVKGLGVPERAAIDNMGAEMGVTTSIFPSGEVTRRFLKAQGREQNWVELAADPGAGYMRVIFPDAKLKNTPVFRGPNIGEPPRSEKMTRDLSGRVMIKLGNNITTDHITPAGARLKYRSNVPNALSAKQTAVMPAGGLLNHITSK